MINFQCLTFSEVWLVSKKVRTWKLQIQSFVDTKLSWFPVSHDSQTCMPSPANISLQQPIHTHIHRQQHAQLPYTEKFCYGANFHIFWTNTNCAKIRTQKCFSQSTKISQYFLARQLFIYYNVWDVPVNIHIVGLYTLMVKEACTMERKVQTHVSQGVWLEGLEKLKN